MPYKFIFREALTEVGVIPDLQAIIWGYFERNKFTFGSQGDANGEFAMPLGVCVNKDLVYVSDSDHNRVQGDWSYS